VSPYLLSIKLTGEFPGR